MTFFPCTATVSRNMADSDPRISSSYSPSHLKRPRPQEALITGFEPVTSRQTSSSFGINRTLSVGSASLKLEPRNYTSKCNASFIHPFTGFIQFHLFCIGFAATLRRIPASQAKPGHVINHHLSCKMPRILSRGQNVSLVFSKPLIYWFITSTHLTLVSVFPHLCVADFYDFLHVAEKRKALLFVFFPKINQHLKGVDKVLF